jgi:hypothetical protein
MTKKTHPPRAPRTRKRKDTMTEDQEPRSTTLALAKKMDAAVRDADTKRQAVEAARATFDDATSDYTAAVTTVRELHQQYDALMQDILQTFAT